MRGGDKKSKLRGYVREIKGRPRLEEVKITMIEEVSTRETISQSSLGNKLPG